MSDSINYSALARKLADALLISRVKNEGLKLAKREAPQLIKKLDAVGRKGLRRNSLSKEEIKLLKKLMHPKYGPAVYEYDGRYFLKKERGQIIKLVYNRTDERCESFAYALREECWKRGASVLLFQSSSWDSRRKACLMPVDSFAEFHEVNRCLFKHLDLIIYVGGDEIPDWKLSLEKKLKVGSKVNQLIYELADRYKTKRCLVGFPVRKPRKYYPEGVGFKEYEKIYLNSITSTFLKRTTRLCEYYFRALKGAKRVLIVADDGTELSFSIQGRKPVLSDGRYTEEKLEKGDVILNIPDGEVFVAPIEGSANGRIRFDYISLSGFGVLEDFWIEFRRGRIFKFWGRSDDVRKFRNYLKTHTGNKDRIAELGIGTNPAARFVNETIVDEKIFGSIHIAIGDNRSFPGGKNAASNHQDMIKMMRGCGGKIYVDGKLIMDDGVPVRSP